MKKIFVCFICALCVGSAFAAGENVATSKAFVDNAVAQKQDKIPANTNPNNSPDQVLTNTGESGNVGTKDIYDSSAAYADQTDSLVTAGDMNAAVQTAIEAEFQCIKWVDDDPTKDCLLVEIQQNLLGTPVNSLAAKFDTQTHIMTNTATDTYEQIHLYGFLTDQLDGQGVRKQILSRVWHNPGTQTFTFLSSDLQYLYIKHDGKKLDNRLFWTIEPNTRYTLTVTVLSNDPTVVGGIKIYLNLKRDNYLPSGN